MNKKGFTLIELLAVIVILAIIALIATPIVLNIIKDTRESAGLRSSEMYLDAVEQAVSIEKMNNTKFNPNSCKITDGNLICDENNKKTIKVEVKGEKPSSGSIKFEKGKITEVRLEYKNNKIILKNEKGNLEYFDYNKNSDINFIVEGIPEQKTTTGNQLFDISKFKSLSNGNLINNGDGSITIKNYIDINNKISEVLPTIKVGDRLICSRTISFGGSYIESKTSFVVTQEMLNNNKIGFYANNNTSAENPMTIKNIMFNLGDVLLPYEPYTGGKPSPSPEYPQEIPLTGILNPKTGKYDISVTASNEDGSKSQSLTLTSPVQLTKWDKLVKKDGVWGWSIFGKEYAITGNEQFTHANNETYVTGSSTNMFFMQNDRKPQSIAIQGLYCSELFFVPSVWSKTDGTIGINNNGSQTHIRLLNYLLGVSDDATRDEKVVAYRNYLRQRYNDGNPIILLYETIEEQAFHPLSDEEQNLLYNLKF